VSGLFWCYVGYPLTMLLASRRRSRPVISRGNVRGVPRVSVVLAVRNGAPQLAERLDNLLAQSYPPDRMELLVICNGCEDATHGIAEEYSRKSSRVRVLVSSPAEGKAGALNLGVASSTGEITVFVDIRQSFAPDAIARLVEAFADPEVGAVSGRLLVKRADQPAVEGVRMYWGMETALRLAESRTGSVVGATGAIYAIRRHCFEPVPANTILDDLWLPMRIIMRGHRVVLEPSAVATDTPAESLGHEYRRKRRTMVGNLQLLRILPALLSASANPVFIRYVSHKLLRLASPFLFIGMLVTAALVPEPAYRAVALLELAVYLLGFLGLAFRIPLLSLASAFVIIHAAIFAAFRHFRADAASVWTPARQPEPILVAAPQSIDPGA
jgi:cellulose synthase/poly-beta-1,6-N-acetylglucosamine synthase-like glycosyltransferase